VIGDTAVNNIGVGTGDSKTVIDASILQGGGELQNALLLQNPAGNHIVDILGASQFGTGTFIAPQPIVFISNLGGGGSRTTFTGANDIAGPDTTTVYGDVQVVNGASPQGFVNIVTFDRVNVLGTVFVTNDNSNTETFATGVTLGSFSTFGLGGPFVVRNNAGFDQFTMTDSTIPRGVSIDNDFANLGNSNWGSITDVSGSKIGELLNPIIETAFSLRGDNLADTFTLRDSTIFAILDLQLRNGANVVLLQNNPATVSAFNYIGGSGNDSVTIDNTKIQHWINIQLHAGADKLKIINENYATQWPSALLESIIIDAGLSPGGGVDTFSGVLPPNDVFQGFDFFTP
jgi:hypothetical protein